MTKFKHLWLSIIVFGTILLVPKNVIANTEESSTYEEEIIVESNKVAVFEEGEIEPITKLSDVFIEVDKLEVDYDNQTAEIFLDLIEGDSVQHIEFSLDLFASEVDRYGESVIGIELRGTGNYHVASFRIENDSDTLTLMEPNLHLENEIVLSLGIEETANNTIYYYQTSLDNFDFEQINLQSNVGRMNNNTVDLEKIEMDYLRLKTDENRDTVNFQQVEMNFNENSKNTINEEPMDEDIESASVGTFGSVIPNIDDELFKSGPIQEWNHGSGILNQDDGYAYSLITYLFAGTQNRETFVVYLEWLNNIDWDTITFTSTLRMSQNVSVPYNVYNESFGEVLTLNRLNVYDPVLYHTAENSEGFFWARRHEHRSTGSVVNNILRATISLVPYLGQGQSFIDHLTSSTVTQNGTLYQFPSTIGGQIDAHGGIIQEIEIEGASDNPIRVAEDYLLLQTQGIAINDMRYGFSYNVAY